MWTLANRVLAHWDSIANDVGKMHIDDLIDHWFGCTGESVSSEERVKLIALNRNNTTFTA